MKKYLKILLYVFSALFTITFLLIYWSPYGSQGEEKKSIKSEVFIDAPAEYVFDYMGISENASKWSVFVSHIRTLNEEEVPDGQAGSIRRCFVNLDESGTQWDEEILEVVDNQKRRLGIFNMIDFPVSAENLETNQCYEPINKRKCKLSLSLYFNSENTSLATEIKMYFASYKIQKIFDKNLTNIKAEIEKQFLNQKVQS